MKVKSAVWVFWSLLLAVTATSCGSDEGGGDYNAPAPLEAVTSALAEGRQVDVLPGAGLGSYKQGSALSVDPRESAKGAAWAYANTDSNAVPLSWLDLVVASCDVPVRTLYGDAQTSGGAARHLPVTLPSYPDSGFFVERGNVLSSGLAMDELKGSPVGYWGTSYSDRPWLTQALLLCAGQKSLELAQALSTTYVVGYTPDGKTKPEWIIATDKEKDWPKSWRQHEQMLRSMTVTKSFSLPAWDSTHFKTLFSIPAANAEQAATWSLLAVDFFRESSLVGAYGMDQLRILARDTTTAYAELPDGKRLTLAEVMVSNLSDALTSLEDAAERAQLYVSAATASTSETERDRVEDWRGRFGSRLEAARVFAAIDPTLFQTRGLVPLYRLTSSGINTGNGVVVKQDFVTTNVAAGEVTIAAGGETVANRSIIGYVYPPYLPQPEGTEKLWRTKSGLNTFTLPESLYAASSSAVLEGYVPVARDPASAKQMLELTRTGSAASNYKLSVASTQSDGTSNRPAVFGLVVSASSVQFNVEQPKLSGLYPVVETLSASNRDRIAENTIRSLRVSPVVCDGSGSCDAARVRKLDGEGGLIDDMRKAEIARLNKANFWASWDAYLASMPFNDISYVRNAAQRVAQQSQVLGRAITVDSSATGVPGVRLVRGTRKDLLPVEPAYLQARTDGFTRFGQGGASNKIDVEFARRGVHQTALYVRAMLDGNPPAHPGIADTVAKMKSWIDAVANGYLRVEMTPNGDQVDLNLSVREINPSKGVYEVWVGEDGLECALRGSTSGLSCAEADYRVAPAFTFNADKNETLVPGQSGSKISHVKLKGGRRVYLTKSAGAKRRAVAGFTLPTRFETSGSRANLEWRRLPLISDTVAQAYRDTLAADPEESYRGEKFCNGLIDYDLRAKLQDKLTGKSALEHAMESARTAAERADSFGDNVVAAGLAMDERSELARDALEDLCGASTDLESLPGSQDQNATNQDQNNTNKPDPITTASGSNGLSACMADEKDLAWVSAGTSAHCAWRLSGQPLCDCGNDQACQNWVKAHPEVACPVSPLKVNDALHNRTGRLAADGVTERKPADLNKGCEEYARDGDWFPSGARPPAALSIKYEALTIAGHALESGSLGESARSDITPPSGWEQASTRCEMLSALFGGAYKKSSDAAVRQAFSWLDFDTVRDAVAQIGIRVDPYGRYELTLGGEPWLKVGSLSPLPFNRDPYNENGKAIVSSADRRYWPNVTTPWPVSNLTKSKVCNTREAQTNLLYCTGFDWDSPGNATMGGQREASRIEAALLTLQHLTGVAVARDDWEWDKKEAAAMGRNKEYVTTIEQVGRGDAQGRAGAFGCTPNASGLCLANDVFFGLDDDVPLMATDAALYPVPDSVSIGSKQVSYADQVNPANWIKAAAFRGIHEDLEIDDKFDADEFVTNSTVWRVLKNPDAPESHTAIEWTYHPPKKRKWWQKSADWVSGVILADAMSGGTLLGGAVPLSPELLTAAAVNLGVSFVRRGRGRWTKEEWEMSRGDLFDAFSLVCMALDEQDGLQPVQSVESCDAYFSNEPTLRNAANGADCVAKRINRQFDEMYVPMVPQQLVSTLMADSGELAQIVPTFSGQYAEAASTLNADLETYRSATAAMSRGMNDLAYHTRTVANALKRLKNDREIKDVQLMKDISNQVTACVVAGASAAGMDFVAAAGRGAAAGATCANTALQMAWSMEIDKLQEENLDLSQAQQLDDFKQSIETVLARIDEQMLAMRQAHSRIHGAIAKMASIRASARRAKARANLEWDLGNGRVNNVNAVMRARMNTNLFRYQEAWRQAVRYAFLARKAVEQRFGVELDTMTHRMSLFGKTGAGQAPYEWADTICYKRGIDYERIRSGQSNSATNDQNQTNNVAAADDPRGYADSYVSDYVTKLSDFIESYRVDFPFDEGLDTVVISMRDELKGVRKLDCSVEGPNHILNSSVPESGLGFWTCPTDSACAAFTPTTNESPLPCDEVECQSWQRGIRASRLSPTFKNAPSATAFDVPKSAIEQVVSVEAGTYTMSWYEQCRANTPSVKLRYRQPQIGGVTSAVAYPDSQPCDCQSCPGSQTVTRTRSDGTTDTWVRRITTLQFYTGGNAAIGFELSDRAGATIAGRGGATVSTVPTAVIGAPQLERGPRASGYFPTDNDFESPAGICEDTTGEQFRSFDQWTYRCETYCPAGYGTDCQQRIPDEQLPSACFYETTFAISQEEIERGRLITEAGFSKGNFNYRIEDLAVNFVGTALRSCEHAELSSACYAGQFLQYSLHQNGPFRVRNFEGDLYAAPLFTGNVQMAKGLTAERYLTNPLSSADRSLLSEYWRTEFKERPLDGEYTLRVYDMPSLQWNHLEDIQLVLHYSYWTRSK